MDGKFFEGILISLTLSFLLNWAGCAITARIVKKPITKGRYFLYCLLVNSVIMIIWVAIITSLLYLLTGEFSITGSSFNLIALFLWTSIGMLISKNTLSKRGLLIGSGEHEKNRINNEINKETDKNKKIDLILCEMSLDDSYSSSSDYAWLMHLKEQTKAIKISDDLFVYDILIKMATDEDGYQYAKQIIRRYDSYKGNLKNKDKKNDFINLVNACWNKYNEPISSNDNVSISDKNKYIFCRKCGAKMPKDSTFCAACGEKFITISDKCPCCGKKLLEGAKFCNKCGKEVC